MSYDTGESKEEDISEVRQVVLTGIASNMAATVVEGEYGAISTSAQNCGYYMVKFLSCPYVNQEAINVDGQIIAKGAMIADACYLELVDKKRKDWNDWYIEPIGEPQLVTVAMRTLVHPHIPVFRATEKAHIPKRMCIDTGLGAFFQRTPVQLPTNEHEVLLDEISRRDKLEFDQNKAENRAAAACD
jgi:hypothetical protein